MTPRTMAAEIAVLSTNIKNLEKSLEEKHRQNRNDIHDIRDTLEEHANLIWKLKLKQVMWTAGGGAATAAIVQAIQHIFK